jgi:hypothetical protein
VNDGDLLFLQRMISKMRPEKRIVVMLKEVME